MVRVFQGLLAVSAVAAVVWVLSRLTRQAPPAPAPPAAAAASQAGARLESSAPAAPGGDARRGERETSVIPPLKFIQGSSGHTRADGTAPPPPPGQD